MKSSLRRLVFLVPLFVGGLMGAAVGPVREAGLPTARQSAPQSDSSSTSARVIVKFRNNASVLQANGRAGILSAGTPTVGAQLASSMAARLGVALTDGRSISPRSQVLMASGMSSQVLAEKLAADADVEWAVPDRRRFIATAPNDPLYGNQTSGTPAVGQWYLRTNSGTVKSAIDAETAWGVTQGSANVVVAVLDTGVVKTHPDLSSKLVAGYDFISVPAVANDGDALDGDASDPGDWVTTADTNNTTFKGCTVVNSSWHGTRTASLIGAATNNGVGMAGVAPNVKIMPVRVLGKCGGYDSDIQAGMRWAAGLSGTGVAAPATPARVLNMSLGGEGSCTAAYQSVINELTAANVTVVVAAGNDGLAVASPGNCAGVIAVAGVRHAGTKVGYSDLGPEVSLAAPAGNCVNTTGSCLYPIITAGDTGTTSPVSSNYSDGNNASYGTSFAAPLVAGTAALMVSANPSLTAAQVASLLKSTVNPFPDVASTGVNACTAPTATAQDSECACTTSTCGAGMLNAGAAVKAAAATAAPPTASISTTTNALLVGDVLSLDGSASSASGGLSIASYLWQVTAGTATFSSSTTAATTTLTPTAAGTLTVQLTVTDNLGRTTSTTKSFSVGAGRPTASISAPATSVAAGGTLALTGSGTAQGTAGITGYLWEITSGTTLASFSGSTTAASATLQGVAAGTVTVRLTVTDSLGYTGSATQTVTVTAATSSGGSSSTTSSGGGGGATSATWLLLLLAAALVLPRRKLRAARIRRDSAGR